MGVETIRPQDLHLQPRFALGFLGHDAQLLEDVGGVEDAARVAGRRALLQKVGQQVVGNLVRRARGVGGPDDCFLGAGASAAPSTAFDLRLRDLGAGFSAAGWTRRDVRA